MNNVKETLETIREIDRDELEKLSQSQIMEMFLLVRSLAIKAYDKTLGAREAAELFNKRKTWIYDAINRPSTDLHHAIARIAIKDSGGLIFRLSDLLMIIDEMKKESEVRCQS